MRNPFVYGEAVTEDNFCNRENEVKKLSRDLLNSQKVFLISARRLGKTSLIKTVLKQIKKRKIKTVYFDVESISTYKKFLNAYLNALVREATPISRVYEFARRLLPGIRLDLNIGETGTPGLSLGYKPTDPNLENVAAKIYKLPPKIARGSEMVVVFDEFQEILKLNGQQIEAAMRASIQHQRNVGYVFAGSKRHLLIDMATSPKRPFYKSGPVMYLEKISPDIFEKFVSDKFRKSKMKISTETILKIFQATQNIPYYVQMLCHELWDFAIAGQKEIKGRDVKIVFNQLVKQYDQNFRLDWDRLIIKKRQVLQTIASRGGRNLLSNYVLSNNELGYPSGVQRTLESLVDEGYIDKCEDEYFIGDILFGEWIKLSTL